MDMEPRDAEAMKSTEMKTAQEEEEEEHEEVVGAGVDSIFISERLGSRRCRSFLPPPTPSQSLPRPITAHGSCSRSISALSGSGDGAAAPGQDSCSREMRDSEQSPPQGNLRGASSHSGGETRRLERDVTGVGAGADSSTDGACTGRAGFSPSPSRPVTATPSPKEGSTNSDSPVCCCLPPGMPRSEEAKRHPAASSSQPYSVSQRSANSTTGRHRSFRGDTETVGVLRRKLKLQRAALAAVRAECQSLRDTVESLQQSLLRSESLAQELCHAKTLLSEQQSVLDRLGLAAPYPESLIRSAVRAVRRLRERESSEAQRVCEPPTDRGVSRGRKHRSALVWECLKNREIPLRQRAVNIASEAFLKEK